MKKTNYSLINHSFFHILCLYIPLVNRFYGFSNALVFKNIEEEDVQALQCAVRNELSDFLESSLVDAENILIQKTWFFGPFSSEPTAFFFLPDERKLIAELIQHVRDIVDAPTENSRLDHFSDEKCEAPIEQHMYETTFGFYFGDRNNTVDIEQAFESLSLRDVIDSSFTPERLLPPTRTHALLQKFLTVADINMQRKKPGYRFTYDIKLFTTYMRLLSGCYAYETLQKNLPLALPSLSSTNRYVRVMSDPIVEGHIRARELLDYLTERKLDLVIALSEDATRIDGRIQYDSKSNQIIGFVLPMNESSGMPTSSYPARSEEEISSYFSTDNTPAHFVNTIMAQPLANYPPFCSLM